MYNFPAVTSQWPGASSQTLILTGNFELHLCPQSHGLHKTEGTDMFLKESKPQGSGFLCTEITPGST